MGLAALPARTFGSFFIFDCSWTILEILEKGGYALPFGADKPWQLLGYWLHGVKIVEARKSGKISHLTFDADYRVLAHQRSPRPVIASTMYY